MKVFFVYGTLKNGVVQENSQYILNNKITKTISLIPVGISSGATTNLIYSITFVLSVIGISLIAWTLQIYK